MVMDVQRVDDAQGPVGGRQLSKCTSKSEEKVFCLSYFSYLCEQFLPEWNTSRCSAPVVSLHRPVGQEVC